MKFLAILLLSISLLTVSREAWGQDYFYFGNTNLVGTGALVGGKKNGSWKVYQRKEVEANPRTSIVEVPLDELEENFDLRVPYYRLDLQDNLPDGVMEEFFAGGQVKKIVNYKAGILDGDFFEFNEEGELLFSGRYEQGQRSGEWVVYRSDGTKKSEYTYRSNLLEEFALSYYPSGQLAERIPFEQGVVNGLYESFFPDGRMQQSLVFVGGLEGGPLKQFYADGTLALSCSFNKGLLDGNWEKFSPTGQLEAQGAYRKGERDGDWREMYPEVSGFFWVGRYEKDKKEGIWQVLDSADFVHQEETYLLGSLAAISEFTTRSGLVLDAGRLEKGDGKRYFFDQKGNRLEKGRYANGQRTGIWYTYFPNTNLVASSGGYVANKKRGNWKYYDINSQLVSEEIIPAGGETESIDRSVSTSSSPQGRTRSYMPQQNSKGVVVPQFRILTPDGGVGITGPGMFQLGN
jgi:antitoxin component YwqK of YwqJK toxin-antitoxin module